MTSTNSFQYLILSRDKYMNFIFKKTTRDEISPDRLGVAIKRLVRNMLI